MVSSGSLLHSLALSLLQSVVGDNAALVLVSWCLGVGALHAGRFIADEVLGLLEEWRPAAAAKPLSLEILRDAMLLVYPQAAKPIGISSSGGGSDAQQGFKVDFSRFYRVHVHVADSHSNGTDGGMAAAGGSGGRGGGRRVFSGFQKKVGRTLSMWCMHPGIALAQLKALGVRSIVLTSGTLSPISALVTEFAPLKFP